jgi:hypothetical protein
MNTLKVDILYIALHNELTRDFGVNRIIPRKLVCIKLGRFHHLSNGLRQLVIKELEQKGILEVVNRDNVKILPLEIDLVNNSTKLFELVGLLKDSNTKK